MRAKITDKTLSRKPPKEGQVEIWDTALPGFGLRLSYGGKRTFFIMTRVHGRQVRRKVGSPETMKLGEARDKAREMMREAAKGIDPKEAERRAKREAEQARRVTFRTVAQDYLADAREGGGAHLRSKAELERKLEKDIYPEWGDRPISEITRADVLDLIRDKAKKAPVSANRIAALVGRIFGWALEQDKLSASPAVRLRRQRETPRERVLSDAELKAVWQASAKLGYPYGAFVRAITLTGQRRSEVAGVRWREIIGDGWRLPAARAKTGVGHLVPLSTQAQALLDDLPRFEDGDYLFSTRDGEFPISGWSKFKRRLDSEILKALRKAAEETGCDPDKVDPMPHWTLHDLRRTCATGMRSLGIDRTTVDKVLNHADGGMIAIYDRYAADPEKRRGLQAWADHIDALVTGRPAAANVINLVREA